MTTRDCKIIRREIDESTPADSLSGKVRAHLNGCAECRTFETEQRTLQGLMAGLETVTAPPDFDFRLRARLAREKSAARNGHGLASLLSIPRPVAIAALVLLLAVVGVLINRLQSGAPPVHQVASKPANVPGTDKPVDKNASAGQNGAGPFTVAGNPDKGELPRPNPPGGTVNGPRRFVSVAQKGTRTAVRETALGAAPELTRDQSGNNGVVRVPLDDQALKISIDDGRGTPHSVSLPIVSFGSQRLMMSNSFVPAGSSPKRVW